MKYEIGKKFLAVRRWWQQSQLSGQVSDRATAAQCQSQVHVAVSHEVCNWPKLFSRPSHTCSRVVGCERTSVTRFFPKPVRRDQKRVSHERFNWPKKVLSDESPSTMHSSGGLLYHDSSPFIPTEFSLLAGPIDGAVCVKQTIKGSWYFLTARADRSYQ
jgi:hypothetical protein